MSELPVVEVQPKQLDNEPLVRIPLRTYNEILDYLMNKPYREVATLINHIDQAVKGV